MTLPFLLIWACLISIVEADTLVSTTLIDKQFAECGWGKLNICFISVNNGTRYFEWVKAASNIQSHIF
jgi:hypothetical protein